MSIESAGGTPKSGDSKATAGPSGKPDAISSKNVAKQVAPQTAEPAPEDEEFDESAYHRDRFVLFNALPSSLVSALVHFIAFMILALTTMPEPPAGDILAIDATPTEQDTGVNELKEEQVDLAMEKAAMEEQSEAAQVLQEVAAAAVTPTLSVEVDVAPAQMEIPDFSERTAPKSDLLAQVGASMSAGLDGRGEAEKAKMVAAVGGTAASEKAVAQALKWFVDHQNQDGSWSFDHRTGPCQGRCSDAGTLSDCKTGATAMALLPFLGAGQTHQQGEYKQVVERGLYYLTHAMRVKNEGGLQAGDLAQSGGSMYAHGLAAITLCEAYAMTHDRKLMSPAQLSINHIIYAQDPVGGGWRYAPRQPGDTSVVGWQLMALKSGHMAYLVVDPKTISAASRFLDSTAADEGSRYGYTGPGQGQGTTAVGLLCRMYLGWKRDNPALKRGVEYISRLGPSKGNMYYNYYATQVLRQYCGDPGTEGHEMWDKWNTNIRESLIKDQEKAGHQKGSWYMRGDHGSERGGRIYCTSMATMILEVYYRHMPIYGKQAATEDFPL
jgi:hypothetical protein